MKDAYRVVKAPLITEKGTLVGESGQIIVEVDPHASKLQIKKAVELLFSCKVASVRTLNVLGKQRRRGGRVTGKDPNRKKAYISLSEGQPMDILESI